MTCRLFRTLAPAFAIVLICGFVAQSASGDEQVQLSRDQKIRAAAKQTSSFFISGTFSGILEGFINVGGKDILITKNTSLHRIGKSLMKKGVHVRDVSLFVAGTVKNRIPTAAFIVVRSNNGFGEKELSMTSDEAKHRIPSKSDPSVGELDKDVAE